MVNLEDKLRVYDEVPAGLIDLPSAARKYCVTRNSLHKRLRTGSLRAHGRLNGGVRGVGIILLSEGELARVAESIVSNKHRRGGIPWNIPAYPDTGCEFSLSCLGLSPAQVQGGHEASGSRRNFAGTSFPSTGGSRRCGSDDEDTDDYGRCCRVALPHAGRRGH